MKIGFILGRESELSKAEIFAVLRREKITFEQIFDSREVLILSLNSDFNIKINELGGTIKLFEVLGEDVSKGELKRFIQNNFVLEQTEQRVNFGISAYGKIEKDFVYKVGKTIKNELVEGGLKARYVTGKYKDLSSVIVRENKLLERGFEVILVGKDGKFFVGKTIEVQDYKAYSKRDYGRTSRDDKSGMLPPKLAQIMMNLAEKTKDSVLYDPFCGSGTILQEAILLGYREVIGSDISPKAVEDTKENMKWLSSNMEIKSNIEIFISDFLSPSKQIQADMIVAEGFLGEPIRRNVAQARSDAAQLTDFYLKVFAQVSRMLNNNGRAIIAIPYFIIGKEKVFLSVKDRINLTGLKLIRTLTYSRPDSFVGREIYILEK